MKGVVSLPVTIEDLDIRRDLYVVQKLSSTDLLLGRDTLTAGSITLNFNDKNVIIHCQEGVKVVPMLKKHETLECCADNTKDMHSVLATEVENTVNFVEIEEGTEECSCIFPYGIYDGIAFTKKNILLPGKKMKTSLIYMKMSEKNTAAMEIVKQFKTC